MTRGRRVYRVCAGALAGAVVALGLLSRAIPLGVVLWDQYMGDALYAALVFLGLAVARPVWSVGNRAAIAAVFVTAIELFQLTQVPATLNRSDVAAVRLFAYLVLGSGFNWWDLAAYAAGIAAVAALDHAVLRRLHAGGRMLV